MSVRFRLAALAVIVTLCAALPLSAQLTVAERTHGDRTSSYADVMVFIDSLHHRVPSMVVGTLGESPQGKRLPYVILSHPQVSTPAAAHATGKPIYYIEANIHAGEVEGKSAVQELMRDLTTGSLRPLLDSIVVLFVPIYNADGNDEFGPEQLNRREQNGPALVGWRANGQGYDLNRDYVKQDAPETRASLAFINKWNPDVFMDLHTTDGSYHGYALTWSPGLNANHTPTNDWVQDTVLEQVRQRLREREHFETYPYGNFAGGNANPTGWDTYESLPRYGTNLNGMTRVSILSEAFSHDPLPRRIAATYAFVLESIRYLAEHKAELRHHEALTAAFRPESVVVRGNDLKSSPARMDTVLVAITDTVAVPPTTPEDSAAMAAAPRVPQQADIVGECSATTSAAGRGRGGFGGGRGAGRGGPRTELQLTGKSRPVYMEVRDRFGPVRSEAMPAAYILGSRWTDVIALMRRQGIQVERTTARWTGPIEQFAVDSLVRPSRPFEGHCSPRIEGNWGAATADTVATGSYVVSTNQRFGMLAAFLLEPASEDGYATWNYFDKALAAGEPAPVRRVMTMPALHVVNVR